MFTTVLVISLNRLIDLVKNPCSIKCKALQPESYSFSFTIENQCDPVVAGILQKEYETELLLVASSFNTTILASGVINVQEKMDLTMDKIELGSHTDCRGSIASNEKLSDNRAKASAAYVQSKITNPNRIYGKGYGESKLKNGCACEGAVKSTCSEAEHQENRRTEFIIVKM